jgi:hypothetical protein
MISYVLLAFFLGGVRSVYGQRGLPMGLGEDTSILAKLNACFSWVKLIGIAPTLPCSTA